MDQRTVRVAVVAVLCIVALGAAAATLDDATTTGGGGGSAGDGSGLGEGDGSGIVGGGNNTSVDRGIGGYGLVCVPYLKSMEFLLVLLAVVLVVGGLITWYENWLVAGAILLTFAMPLSVVYLMLTTCSPATPSREEVGVGPINGSSGGGGDGGFGGGAADTVPTSPSLVLLALVGVVLLVAVVVIARNTDDDSAEMQQPTEASDDDETVEALGRVAGEAADRIDAEGNVDNEVYRAWREMVALLEVERPEATTPGEFADAAVAAGMDRRHVAELTDLFEAVRYGGAQATTDRETRAVEALRSIERAYAGETE